MPPVKFVASPRAELGAWLSGGRRSYGDTETAVEWTGYLEGAVESGERVAAHITETHSDSAPGRTSSLH